MQKLTKLDCSWAVALHFRPIFFDRLQDPKICKIGLKHYKSIVEVDIKGNLCLFRKNISDTGWGVPYSNKFL